MHVRKETPLEIHWVYLGNKEIYFLVAHALTNLFVYTVPTSAPVTLKVKTL
jgi:hypothetical protein